MAIKSALGRVARLPRRIVGRLAREAVRTLPVSSRHLGPPRGLAPSTGEWCRQHDGLGAKFHALDPRQSASCPEPLTNEPLPAMYYRQLQAEAPERFVAVVPEGRVVHSGLVLTPDDCVLADATYQSRIPAFMKHGLPILKTLKLPPVTRRQGSVAVMASLWSQNYYHWMVDVVPRLHLLQRSGEAVDNYVVSHHLPFQVDTMELLGIAPERCIADDDELHLQAKRLVVPSLPGGQGNPPPWIIQFLREAILSRVLEEAAVGTKSSLEMHSHQPRRKLYVARAQGSSRTITNEVEVRELLESRGFVRTTLKGLSLREQVLLFDSADAVVGPHGAALTNLLFCRPGTKVVEIFAPGWVYPVYNFIGAHAGLKCGCIVGEGKRPLEASTSQFQDSDLTVNLHDLDVMLQKLDL